MEFHDSMNRPKMNLLLIFTFYIFSQVSIFSLHLTRLFFWILCPPTLKKWGTYGFGLSLCVCVWVGGGGGHRDIVLKLHVWIPHGKITDAYFWFSLNYLPLLNYDPLTNKGMKFCRCHISKSIIARNLKLVSADRG